MESIEGFTAWVVTSPAGELVAHFDLTLTVEPGTVRLGRVIVTPTLRGHGLAHEVVRLALAKAHEQEAARVRRAVISDNEPAVRASFVAEDTAERPDVTVMIRDLNRLR